MTRTTRISYTTPNGTVVDAHQTTGLSATHPWLPSASATARIDLDARHADIGTVEADITRYTPGRSSSAQTVYLLRWTGRNAQSAVETFPTVRAALRRMGEVAVATLALEPQHLDFGPGQHGCL